MYRLYNLILLFLLLFFQPVYAEDEIFSQGCTFDPQTTSLKRFKVHGDGTVTDLELGLIWKRCLQGHSGSNCELGSAKKFTWDEALHEAENTLKWRLPNIKELLSIVERRCVSPAINLKIFPINNNGSDNAYNVWSSTPSIHWTGRSSIAIYFYNGKTERGYRESKMYVRLVRSE